MDQSGRSAAWREYSRQWRTRFKIYDGAVTFFFLLLFPRRNLARRRACYLENKVQYNIAVQPLDRFASPPPPQPLSRLTWPRSLREQSSGYLLIPFGARTAVTFSNLHRHENSIIQRTLGELASSERQSADEPKYRPQTDRTIPT